MKRPAITPAMRLNVLKKFGALVLCQMCGNPEYIAVIQIDHELALHNEGKHCEDSNLRPLCIPCHAKKTGREAFERAKTNRIQKKHSRPTQPGTIKSRPFGGWRKFDGSIVRK